MTARIAVPALLAALAGTLAAPATAGPTDRGDGSLQAAPARPSPGGADRAPLDITMPDTQPALPSGMIEMDPSQVPSTGNANELERNIDGRGAPAR